MNTVSSEQRRKREPMAVAPIPSPLIQALRGRRAIAVRVILGINIAVFIALSVTGGSANTDNLIRFGAKYNELIAQGQYWRLVTSMFLHIGLLHLLFNSLALWSFGADLEKLYGAVRFVIIYLVSGVVGSLASYLFSPHVSAGASGAIFGLIGLSFVFGFKYRSAVPLPMRSRFGTGVLPVIIYNILYGVRPHSHIDNYAHIGGLVAGIVLGLVIPASFDIEDPLIR